MNGFELSFDFGAAITGWEFKCCCGFCCLSSVVVVPLGEAVCEIRTLGSVMTSGGDAMIFLLRLI